MIKTLFAIIFIALPSGAIADCDPATIMNEMFTELQKIGDAGEAKLQRQLEQLKGQADWGEQRSNALLLEIADTEQTNQAEEFRDTTITKMFMMQSRPDLDCMEMSGLRDAVIEREQAQWEHIISEISRRLSL